MKNELVLKIYLKSKKQPIAIILDNIKQLDDFYHELLIKDIVKIGPLIFERSEFSYALLD